MNTRHNFIKSQFSAMLHRQCKMNGVSKLQSSYLLRGYIMLLRLSCSLRAKSHVRKYIAIWAPQKWLIYRGVCLNVNIGDMRE